MQSLSLEATPRVTPELEWRDPWTVSYRGQTLFVLAHRPGYLKVRIGGQVVEVNWRVGVHAYLERVALPRRQAARALELRAPMPGLLRELRVQVGQAVSPQTPVAVLEAMKMENLLFAPSEGVVAELPVPVGQAVEKGALLLRLAPPHAD